MTQHTLGDAPIEPRYREKMIKMARALDRILNGDATGKNRTAGFVLLVFPFDAVQGRCNYISTAGREDVKVLLREQLARFEGAPYVSGRG